jgi:hypothetical protein
MKKVFLLATAALMITGVSMADTGKKSKKKCAKGKSCCDKSAASEKSKESKTAKL